MNYDKKTKDELVQEIQRLSNVISSFKTSELSKAGQKKNPSSSQNGALYNLIFNQPFLGIVHFDEDRTIIDCNDQFTKIIGTAREDIIGHNLLNFFDNKDILLSIKDAFSDDVSVFEGEYFNRFHNKEMFIKIYFNSFRNSSENIILGVGFFEHFKAKSNSEKEIELLAHSIQNISECVIITDPQNKFLYVNKAFEKIYGYTSKEIIGKSISILRSLNNPKKINDEIYKSTSSKNFF